VRATAPRGREWVHEIKFDSIRLIVRRDGKRVRVYTRRGFDWTGRFPWIEDAPNQSAMPHRELHMPVIEVRFKLEKETKGALRYRRSMRKAKSSNKPGPRSARSTFAKAHSSAALHSRSSCA
jgi:hypothetical protein